jgi:hypothetical protein
MNRIFFYIPALMCCITGAFAAQDGWGVDVLAYRFAGRYGQVEVGGPYAGAEFHNSTPLPSRISLYSPVANSIDLSTDYWRRGESHPFRVDLNVNGRGVHSIGVEPWEYVLSPHTVTFAGIEDGFACSMVYAFGMKEAVMMYRLTIVNPTSERAVIATKVQIAMVLRTCQTYARCDRPDVSIDSGSGALIAHFAEPQTGRAGVFVLNAGQGLSVAPHMEQGEDSTGWATFEYQRPLAAGDSLQVVLVIGSCTHATALSTARRVQTTWPADVATYDRFIRRAAVQGAVVKTGDPWVDRTIPWANALLAANAHYLDGALVPMPCPAEYNFFFTHDMLLTDLAAAAFDPGRVKRDLVYIAGIAQDSVIPHARYWRDTGFQTEFCPPDDWNHLWFILVAGSYLRHTGDTLLIKTLYPLLSRSVGEALRRLKSDDLMYALAPDWWDIGKNDGPRAYMTALVIRALREFAFICATVHQPANGVRAYESRAASMQQSLRARLWDTASHYLVNYNGNVQDPHVYMGSLLAPVFGLLDSAHAQQLVETAGRNLLAAGIGIRAVMPPDFHTDAMRSFFHFVDNEAGGPYLYINGGVWPHNNAWYVLALCATGHRDEAFRFYRTTMTLDGIVHSPMGQPAFYEYRSSDPASARYGEIDKPSFLWAAGFSILTGYRLLGIEDNEWNTAFAGSLPSAVDTGFCTLEFRGTKVIRLSGKGVGLQAFIADGTLVPSLVMPLEISGTREWMVSYGSSETPYLSRINAVLHSAVLDRRARTLALIVSSFPGHRTLASIILPHKLNSIRIDGRRVGQYDLQPGPDGSRTLTVPFAGADFPQKLVITY